MAATGRDTLYSHAQMARLCAPKSVAIVGASPRAGSFGANVRDNCAGYEGELYLVNPGYEEIDGQRCYPSLAALPVVPDSVVVTVKRELVQPVIEECVELGIGGAIIFASGFAEVGIAQRAEEQRRLVEIARKGGVLIAGPNTVGSSNFVNGALLTFSPDMLILPPTNKAAIGVVSQSGAVGYSQSQAMHHGANLSHMLVCGNSADVDIADYVGYLAEEPSCHAIVCMIEGMDDPNRLVTAAKKVRDSGKPLILFKAARGEIGAAAAMSHTGSMAGSHKSYVAALEAVGAIFIDDQDALLDTAAFLAKAGTPSSDGVAIITASGGWGIICADHAEDAGIALPPLPAQTHETLAGLIPEFGAVANPCDVTAQILANRESFAKAAGSMLQEDCYGLLVFPQTWTTKRNEPAYERMFEAVGDVAREHGKVACMIWTSGWLEGPGVAAAERNDSVAVFRSARHCFNAIAIWHKRAAAIKAQGAAPASHLSPETAASNVKAMLQGAPDKVIGERSAKAMLSAYGVSVVGERTAATAEDAAKAASEMGFPVVVKVESPDVPHKSEAGGVRLNLNSEAEVLAEGKAALEAVAAYAPDARIDGLLVQTMLGRGVEMLVGSTRDAHFGPMIVVGLGGVLTEIMADVALRPAPVSVSQARAMIAELRGRAILDGARNLPKVDIEALAEAVARVSELAFDQRNEIAEIDVNPLICDGDRIVAADALIIRG
ncbi:acetate--CoA ligase family protein [Novosphingobium pentaromativorans]|uniref:ATP-grasp domain-containing protein n=1 Tax=Novosphingobium pentaromativorans US6-1 TaxID=1088721 RepID=G6E851_9SPHN|nr:acetate--CoA ligase family protein [Novosphingobium pentaromativorans]AIT81443.1 hypothetical protein JI59_17490 [Novosphingobium pentaromativorans US6-1]EHJ62391.1 hypothetical protein NSU_0522 [Novosphingobium pentaromativorans US6-1]